MSNVINDQFSLDPNLPLLMDEQDPLAALRKEFHIPSQDNNQENNQENKQEVAYFCGNSLGLQPRRTAEYTHEVLSQWQSLAVKGHFEGPYPWMPYHELLTEPLAQLVGALPEEVVAMNSLTANLHLMMATFFKPDQKRTKIVIEQHAFPSDHYAVESQLIFHQLDPKEHLITLPHRDDLLFYTQDWLDLIDQQGDSIALIVLPGVHYYSGQFLDLKSITEAAHAKGCLVGVDLAHAVGNTVLSLHQWEVDFAVWCHYKYVNSGPGAVGGCFVHQRHAKNTSLPRLSGWWGHDKESRFQMHPQFQAIASADGWQLSNPPIVSLAAIRASLEVFSKAGGMAPLREKSKRLTAYFEYLINEQLNDQITIITPSDPQQRGCQLSLVINNPKTSGKALHQHLNAQGVSVDWREPNVIRAAPVPLYNRFQEVHQLVEILKEQLL